MRMDGFVDWACFLVFTILINVIMQILAWKIGFLISGRRNKDKKKENNDE